MARVAAPRKKAARYMPDEKDELILDILRKDARAPVRRISNETGVRPSTVHSRMDRLVRSGVIERFTVKVDPEASGRSLVVYMLVTGSTGKYLDDKMLRDPCIEEVHGVTGEYDILMKLRFRDMKEFNRFVIDFREKHTGSVTRTITMVGTARLK